MDRRLTRCPAHGAAKPRRVAGGRRGQLPRTWPDDGRITHSLVRNLVRSGLARARPEHFNPSAVRRGCTSCRLARIGKKLSMLRCKACGGMVSQEVGQQRSKRKGVARPPTIKASRSDRLSRGQFVAAPGAKRVKRGGGGDLATPDPKVLRVRGSPWFETWPQCCRRRTPLWRSHPRREPHSPPAPGSRHHTGASRTDGPHARHETGFRTPTFARQPSAVQDTAGDAPQPAPRRAAPRGRGTIRQPTAGAAERSRAGGATG